MKLFGVFPAELIAIARMVVVEEIEIGPLATVDPALGLVQSVV